MHSLLFTSNSFPLDRRSPSALIRALCVSALSFFCLRASRLDNCHPDRSIAPFATRSGGIVATLPHISRRLIRPIHPDTASTRQAGSAIVPPESLHPRQHLLQPSKVSLPPVLGALEGLLLIRPEARMLHAQVRPRAG